MFTDQAAKAISQYALEAGVPGFTWYAKGRTATLESVAVRAFGGDPEKHRWAMDGLAEKLLDVGYRVNTAERPVRTTIMERSGENAYDRYLTGTAQL